MKLRYFIGSLLIALFGAVTAVTATSCGAEPTIGDANWVDYVKNGTVKLGLDHKNRSFWTDGVEEVTLKSSIDGDTAQTGPAKGPRPASSTPQIRPIPSACSSRSISQRSSFIFFSEFIPCLSFFPFNSSFIIDSVLRA